jgi:dihydroorotate dehydrogenase
MLDAFAKLLLHLPPEMAQNIALFFLRAADVPPLRPLTERCFAKNLIPDDPRLEIHALGRVFSNPLGQAAGLDKDSKVLDNIFYLGFGFAECGTVTPNPQLGNPGKRLFRLAEDRAVINRMGFNNSGADAAVASLRVRRRRGILGINIGANKNSSDRIADYVSAFRKVAPYVEYVTANVSSPNTPGLRDLQKREQLERLLGSLTDQRHKMGISIPILLKLAPDVGPSDMDAIADVSLSSGIDGLVVSNTTVARPTELQSAKAREAGGLSGTPLFSLSTTVLKEMRVRVSDRLTLVGVGGIKSGQDAYAKIRAGASLLQLYTGLIYEGPGLIPRIKNDLVNLLVKDGFSSLSQAIGVDAR